MKIGLLVFVALAGILNTVQSGLNTTLNKTVDRPLWSVVCVFSVALATALAIALVSGQRPPSGADLARLPWWAWTGGMLGAVYIVSMVLAADKLGAAVFMCVTVTMAVLTSLAMDHFALLGFDRHPAGPARIAGGLLMVAGLLLIARY